MAISARPGLLITLCLLAVACMGPFGSCACQNPVGPSMGPTPVPPTPTPTPSAVKYIYNGETAGATLAGAGTWVSPAAGSPKSSFVEGPAYAYSGTKGLHLVFAWPDPAWYGGFGFNRCNWSPAPACTLNGLAYTHLEFWLRGAAGGEQNINVALVDTLNRATGAVAVDPLYIPAVSTAWQHVKIPLADFNWGSASRGSVYEVDFASGYASAGAATIDIDEVRFAAY